MLKKIIPHKIILALMVIFLAVGAGPSTAMEDAIVAVVNDQIITLKDLRDYIRQTYVELVARGLNQTQLKEAMRELEADGLDKLIEEKLIISQANKIQLTVRSEKVDEEVQAIIDKYPSEQQFLDALIENGATITDLRNKIENQLKKRYVVEHEVRSKIDVKPQEITSYYKNNFAQFRTEEQAELKSIFVAFKDNKEKSIRKAEDALRRILEGEEFDKVAAEVSDTPPIGTVKRSQLTPQIEDIIFSLKEGETSHLIEVENGIYIFKLIRTIPSQTASLEQVQKDIKSLIFNNKFRDRYEEWLENLKDDAYIDIKQ